MSKSTLQKKISDRLKTSFAIENFVYAHNCMPSRSLNALTTLKMMIMHIFDTVFHITLGRKLQKQGNNMKLKF